MLSMYRRVLHCRYIGAVYCRCTGGFSTVDVQEGSPLSVCRGLYTVTVQEGSPLSVYRGCILSVYRRVLHCQCTVLHCRCVGGCILSMYRRVLHCRCIGAVYCRCTGGFSTVGI